MPGRYTEVAFIQGWPLRGVPLYIIYILKTPPINYVLHNQGRHRDELEQVRSAGHSSLAIIVEQYKVSTVLATTV